MTEDEFLERWASDQPMYQAWGNHVADTIAQSLTAIITPLSIDVFLRVSPRPARAKGDISFLEKAFYRKSYSGDPYDAVTDKVGVRFVVLTDRDIPLVEEAVTNQESWSYSKDKDFEEEREKSPLEFPYAAKHYIVRPKEALKVEGFDVPAGAPCEVQIKTILQHAYSEISHDSIYKPSFTATPTMQRAAAKSMALIEATNDYFEKVLDEFTRITEPARLRERWLREIYIQRVGQPPQPSKAEGLLAETLGNLYDENSADDINRFFDSNAHVGELIRDRSKRKLLYRQPSIVAVFWLASIKQVETKRRWPFTPEELRPIFVDLGIAFDV